MNNDIDIEKLRNYINDLEEKVTPLTKARSKKDVKKEEPEPIEEEPVEEEPEPVRKKITRTVTEKKKEQLIKAREVKKENMEKRKALKKLESAKLLLKEEISKPKPELVSSESASEVETDEEIIVVKKKQKTKKKPKKKIIIQEDSSESSESDDEEEPEPIKKKSFGKSHRNKKSVVKVHQHPSHNHQPVNYFCD